MKVLRGMGLSILIVLFLSGLTHAQGVPDKPLGAPVPPKVVSAIANGQWSSVRSEALTLASHDPGSGVPLFLADVATTITRDYSSNFKSLLKYDYPYSDKQAIDRVARWIDSLISSDAKNANFLILKATLQLKAYGDEKKATELLEEAYGLAPKDEFILVNLGNGYGSHGQKAKAKSLCDKAIMLNPQSSGGYNCLGMVAMASGNTGEARKMFEKAVSFKEVGPLAWSNLGSLYYSQKRLPEARKALEKAVELSPKLIDARFNLAGTYYSLGMKQNCIVQLEKIIEIDPESPTGRRAQTNLRVLVP